MRPTIIDKDLTRARVQPNLVDHKRECVTFSWELLRKELAGMPNGGAQYCAWSGAQACRRFAESVSCLVGPRCIWPAGT